MDFKERLDELVVTMVEVADTDRINIEWHRSVYHWKNQLWTLVNKMQPYTVKENVLCLRASVIDLSDPKSLERFRKAGSRPTYHFVALWRIREMLSSEGWTHIFIEGVGETEAGSDRTRELLEWIDERLGDKP